MQTTTDPLDGLFSGSSLLSELGPAFLIGLAVGYFAKKGFRIGLFLFGGSGGSRISFGSIGDLPCGP